MATVPTITRNVAGSSLSAPPMCSATSGAAKLAAVDAATIPRGSMQPMKIRSFLVRVDRAVATTATAGRTTSTSSATRASAGQITPRRDAGVTVAEIAMNSTPIASWTTVLRNGRSSGRSTPRRFATTIPMVMAATSPVSSWIASHKPAMVITVAMMASVARMPVSFSFFSKNHSTATPTAPPATPRPIRPAKPTIPDSTSWCAWLAVMAWNTTTAMMAPIGSMVVPSKPKIVVSFLPVRAACKIGVTTVGPDTIKMAPSMMAALEDRPSRSPPKSRRRPRSSGCPTRAGGAPPGGCRPPALW